MNGSELKNERAIGMIQRDLENLKACLEIERKQLNKKFEEVNKCRVDIKKMEAQIAEQEDALKKLQYVG